MKHKELKEKYPTLFNQKKNSYDEIEIPNDITMKEYFNTLKYWEKREQREKKLKELGI